MNIRKLYESLAKLSVAVSERDIADRVVIAKSDALNKILANSVFRVLLCMPLMCLMLIFQMIEI